MNFPVYIAKRYLRSKSSQNAVNIINFFTFFVVIIGAAALFIVLSAFAGLKTFSLQFTNTFDPDLKAAPAVGKFFTVSGDQQTAIESIPGIQQASYEIVERVYLGHKDKNGIAKIKGVDAHYPKVVAVDSTLYFGSWAIEDEQAVIGLGIFNALGGPIGNRAPITAITLKPGEKTLTSDVLASNSFYNQMPLVISGVYAVEDDLDKTYVFAPLDATQAFLEKRADQFSGINFKLEPFADVPMIKKAVSDIFGQKVGALTREELNATLHKMLKTENTATYLIFTLVLIIALFNVVGAIIMLILDKRENSKTLFALGATIAQLRQIYFLQGVLVTVLGGIIGIVLGSILVVSQLQLEWWKISPSLAYPVEYQFKNAGIVLATITVLGLLSSKIASSRISKKLLA